MSDQQKLDNLRELRNRITHFDRNVMEAALQIVESLDDRDDRDYYVSVLAEWSANSGGMADLDKAIELTRSVNVAIDRHSALVVIAKRLITENHRERAISILAQAEQAGNLVERDDNYVAWQKAKAWRQIADLYKDMGDLNKATRVWSRAIKLAQSGQGSDDPQNAYECASILVSIARTTAKAGLKDFAIQTAQSIASDDRRKFALGQLSHD